MPGIINIYEAMDISFKLDETKQTQNNLIWFKTIGIQSLDA